MESTNGHHEHNRLKTQVLKCETDQIGRFIFSDPKKRFLGDWDLELSTTSSDAANLKVAASQLQKADFPVAFPTETVYGLGADATRSSAVRGIYKAKQRPSDNPLIVHISSLTQLQLLLRPNATLPSGPRLSEDPIPATYHPLISKFWPGPLTILLPLPNPSPFAPEVTSGLDTVGVRMPSALLALALIKEANMPLAAPSANASSKPSPTTAAHVLHDLSGRISTILDGGPCQVGLESTVVDGLSNPPLILRPGAISLEMLRSCPGWEQTQVGYANVAQSTAPRAPGMKYKHYSPKARVIITRGRPTSSSVRPFLDDGVNSVGILGTNSRTRETKIDLGKQSENDLPVVLTEKDSDQSELPNNTTRSDTVISNSIPAPYMLNTNSSEGETKLKRFWMMDLGSNMVAVAQNLFSGLRELDLKQVDVIFVEGMDDRKGDLVAAVMNRLRKAAEIEVELQM